MIRSSLIIALFFSALNAHAIECSGQLRDMWKRPSSRVHLSIRVVGGVPKFANVYESTSSDELVLISNGQVSGSGAMLEADGGKFSIHMNFKTAGQVDVMIFQYSFHSETETMPWFPTEPPKTTTTRTGGDMYLQGQLSCK